MRSLARYEKAAACRYYRTIIGRPCRRRCLRCTWATIRGDFRRAEARRRARMTRFSACPHANRVPNPKATTAEAEGRNPQICTDCGIGIVQARRRNKETP